MSRNFNENTRVQVPAAIHLCRLGYTYLDRFAESEDLGEKNNFNAENNILYKIFEESVQRLNPDKTLDEIRQVLHELYHAAKNDDLGREFYQKITSTNGIRFIDFDHPDNNSWHCTTEFSCENPDTHDSFRPDITCFVNGLPLAFIEVKRPNNREGMLEERDRMNKRFRNKAFRTFLNVTQLMIFSNNQEYESDAFGPVQGAFYATNARDHAFFSVFRERDKDLLAKSGYNTALDDDVQKRILTHRNCIPIKEDQEFKTNLDPTTPTNSILTSMLSRERFLFLLRYGFAYVEMTKELADGTKVECLEKQVMRYQQLFASFALRQKLAEGVKGGVIWHTQGSGKTAFAFYNVKALTDFYAARQTVVKFFFIVDRLDLLEQASDEFAARGLVVQTVQSRTELMEKVTDTQSAYNRDGKPEIIVVNIQKFEEDHSPVVINTAYSTNLQRVFFIDEAHRGYNPKGSFLANLLNADKNAVKIAMTGTPLLAEERASWRVFGDYIDTYYYDKSIADGYTRKIMREDIETGYKEKIANILEKLAGGIEVKKSDVPKERILEHPQYLNALLDYILEDFRRFRIQMDCPVAAGMIVCETNSQAKDLERLFAEHNKPENLRPGEKPLKSVLILHDVGDKQERKDSIRDFKRNESVDFLIVNAMLLTGFDAPRLKRLYLCRKLDGHTLLQALTRVNRPYKDFRYGYVVDFADIKENFIETNNRYLKELHDAIYGRDSNDDGEDGNILSALMVTKSEVEEKLRDLKEVLFLYDLDNKEEFRKQLDEEHSCEQLFLLRRSLAEAKSLMNQVRSFGDDELKQRFRELAPDAIPQLLSEVNHRIDHMNLLKGQEHAADVSGIINEALSEMEFSFRCKGKEELSFLYNDIQEKYLNLKREFDANFDHKEDAYVNLAEAFKAFFRKHGFAPQTVCEAREALGYMDEVMKKIREINRRNNMLMRKYRDDEKFVRVHKRILEENARRAISPEKPVISKSEAKVMENLNQVKVMIDDAIYYNVNILGNEPVFNQDVLKAVSVKLYEMNIDASLEDRKFVQQKIAEEYLDAYTSDFNRVG
jgi:type I restriction enzyme, R subunit